MPAPTRATRRPPKWPVAMLWVCAGLATVSLLQGIVDVVLPTMRHERPFGVLFGLSATYGPAFFAAYIFVHNMGLACLVPGFGFIAARFEKRTQNRALIGILLTGAVVATLVVAALYLIRAPERFDLRVSVPLFFGEAVSVLALAITATMQLRGFVPTRRYGWSLVAPFRTLTIPFVVSACLLALLATVEARAVLHGG